MNSISRTNHWSWHFWRWSYLPTDLHQSASLQNRPIDSSLQIRCQHLLCLSLPSSSLSLFRLSTSATIALKMSLQLSQPTFLPTYTSSREFKIRIHSTLLVFCYELNWPESRHTWLLTGLCVSAKFYIVVYVLVTLLVRHLEKHHNTNDAFFGV